MASSANTLEGANQVCLSCLFLELVHTKPLHRVEMLCLEELCSNSVRTLFRFPFPHKHNLTSPLVLISIYMFLAVEFMIRYKSDKPFLRDQFTPRSELTTPIKIMLGALGFNILTLFIRYVPLFDLPFTIRDSRSCLQCYLSYN